MLSVYEFPHDFASLKFFMIVLAHFLMNSRVKTGYEENSNGFYLA